MMPRCIHYTHFVDPPCPPRSCDRKINEFVKRVRACKIHMLLVSRAVVISCTLCMLPPPPSSPSQPRLLQDSHADEW